MRRFISGLLAVGLFCLATHVARGQAIMNYEVPPSTGNLATDSFWAILPGPLGHPRYEDGGFFAAVEFAYFQTSNPIGNQLVAIRGFVDDSGTAVPLGKGPEAPGTFHGDGAPALSTSQLHRTSESFQPGFNLVAGWRFQNGWVLQASWMHLMENVYAATASIIPYGHNVGADLANTFLFSGVYNFSLAYAGEPNPTGLGQPGSTFGIWNAASEESIQYLQRFDQFDLTLRMPIWQSDTHRQYATFGPAIVHIFERFTWRTTNTDVTGAASEDDTAIYSNTTSNTLYGLRVGGGHDWFLGATPIGGFSVSLDGQAGLFYNFVKERAKYELGDRSTAATHNRNTYTVVPNLQGMLSLWYYPWEGVQVHLGYSAMAFFNTISSPNPIDFNFGSITPKYESTCIFLNGLTLGVGFVF